MSGKEKCRRSFAEPYNGKRRESQTAVRCLVSRRDDDAEPENLVHFFGAVIYDLLWRILRAR
jgi:hypothetical protein